MLSGLLLSVDVLRQVNLSLYLDFLNHETNLDKQLSLNFSFAWFSRGGEMHPKLGVWVCGCALCTLKSDHLRPRHKERFENSLGYLVRQCLKEQEQSPVGLLSGDPDLPFPETAFVASLPSAGATLMIPLRAPSQFQLFARLRNGLGWLSPAETPHLISQVMW